MPIRAIFYLCEHCKECFENEARCRAHEAQQHGAPLKRLVDAETMVDDSMLSRRRKCPRLSTLDAATCDSNADGGSADAYDSAMLAIGVDYGERVEAALAK